MIFTDLISTADAARALGVTDARVRALIRQGRLPALRVGKIWLVKADGLAGFERRPQGWPKGRQRRPRPRLPER